MYFSSTHVKWLIKNDNSLQTVNGKEVEVWEFRHEHDDEILSEWAKHFRNHYCLDNEIDYLRKGYRSTREEYLNDIKFPDSRKTPGPSIRAGDFGEILVADFLEYLCGYWVPRTRYSDKTIRNESTKGSDIIGFRVINDGTVSVNDCLVIFEAKTQFSGTKPKTRLQDAVNDSSKDITRKAESLNAIKQRLYLHHELANAERIERFQNSVDTPYKEIYGAVALFDNPLFDRQLTSLTDVSSHPYLDDLVLVVIKGDQMMTLVHELYRRAADEA